MSIIGTKYLIETPSADPLFADLPEVHDLHLSNGSKALSGSKKSSTEAATYLDQCARRHHHDAFDQVCLPH
jgi:hypothetical protein